MIHPTIPTALQIGANSEVKLDDAIAKINEILSRDRRHFTTVDQIRAMNRRQLIGWLTWNDRNGTYDDDAHTAEFGGVALTEDLRALAINQIKGAYHVNGVNPSKTGMRYHVFHRTWWTENSTYPNGLEPCAGNRSTITYTRTMQEAVAECKRWCAKHKSGRLSDKAEFEAL